jgi:DNA-binding transcriptional ArsR family regulator
MHADIEDFHVPDADVVDRTCELLRILSDPTRLRLLCALSQGETSVACLADIVGANPTAVSQHLSKLRLAGIVRARRQGTYMFYTVADQAVRSVLGSILTELCDGAPHPSIAEPFVTERAVTELAVEAASAVG